jgi:hypothetical protein
MQQRNIINNFKIMKKILKSMLRILLAVAIFCGIVLLVYALWQPGSNKVLPKFENNAIWLGHGWLGDDLWFKRNKQKFEDFRSAEKVEKLLKKLTDNDIKTVYPHLCPAQFNGRIAAYNDEQIERFLDIADKYKIKVIPWIGGVLDESARPDDVKWRKNFIDSTAELLKKHSKLAGVQINIEPLPSSNRDFLILLEELKTVLKDKTLSVAAYPPPTVWHRFPSVHWDLKYLAKVANHADQMAVMMYDTAIPYRKFYINLYKMWIYDLINSLYRINTEILLGVPAYEDSGVGYHHPEVENISSALSAISAVELKKNISGLAIYCEWEMTDDKWTVWQKYIK